MKVLKLPSNEDPILSRIKTIEKAMAKDPDAIYAEELFILLLDYFRDFSSDDENCFIMESEKRLEESLFWFQKQFREED